MEIIITYLQKKKNYYYLAQKKPSMNEVGT